MKKRIIFTGLIIFVILVVFAVKEFCFIAKTPTSDARALELGYLIPIISQEKLLEYAHIEVPSAENIKIESENNKQYLALRVYQGQELKSGGVRAEVSVDYPYKEGEAVRYSWQVRIPENFQSDAPKNRWWLMGQWHDQPDPRKGETWEMFPRNSPLVAVGYAMVDGQDVFGLIHEHGQKDFITTSVTRGVWHTIAIEIVWSQGDDGRVRMFFDDITHPVAEYTGKNMLNAYQHYLKVGLYRHNEITADSTIHIRDISITKKKVSGTFLPVYQRISNNR
ncbi:MAG: polysaccharide lyase [Candidatus Azambacteria bacterium]|nr:polysaccharide lyase [Candidatus Azambacteria bacterium]